ncbi:tRNA (mo5U34)-methyltransferase [Saliniradius amylolyticus]|uniref:tRNA U34 carboxymethyltransferase n=1 Tax=Saliniradius amylolyticus TaxID=2183582 RepID=A0A2S2E3B0_9ALTE|nr:tRNA 5-methoxyuridine(34)/uridine 5-oxyacetic acid(34) synthase CmoB [Saliniradius amylolyticus]AWL11740.1 tRNA (mo5U34)-methyltransferase [Saliniradius amylolyticus]
MNNTLPAFSEFYTRIASTELGHWLTTLPAQLAQWQQTNKQELQKGLKLIGKLPDLDADEVDLQTQVKIGSGQKVEEYTQKQITGLLQRFKPWRKGPFHIHGIHLDTEWRSDWKWDRVLPHIRPLANKTVLDIGCGSGYHLWRMLGEGAREVIGVDPYLPFFLQFQAIKHFYPAGNINLLPLGIEHLPELKALDTVFSMGVFYHRRSPVDFLYQLKGLLKKDGELVLETLVIEGDEHSVLVPGERYAQMRNVWFIPSTAALTQWLTRVGFSDIKVVDINQTTVDEQRSTSWMTSHSLANFLDPADQNKTIEGYPAPIRAVLVAKAG